MKHMLIQLLERVGDYGFTLVDVGSMDGLEKEWEELADHIRVVGFEPDKREYAKLKSTDRVLYLNKVVASKAEDVRFHVSRDPGKSSVFKPNKRLLDEFPDAARYDTVDTVEFSAEDVGALDSILAEHDIGDVDFLKVDTQGSELAVLQGADGYLNDSLLGLKVEVEFAELYEGQPLFPEVDTLVRGKNFNLMDLRRAYWQRSDCVTYSGRGQLVFGDALYLKDIHSFLESMTGAQPEFATAKVVKFAVVALRYGLMDYADYILKSARGRGLLAEDLAREISGALPTGRLNRGKRLIKGFRGAYRAHTILSFVQRFFTEPYVDWADGDEYLGNK